MSVFFVAFDVLLTREQLAGKRRRLAKLLRIRGIDLKTLPLGGGGSIFDRIMKEARGAVIIALDDGQAEPAKSPAIVELMKQSADLAPARRPRVIYVSASVNAAGIVQALDHPVIKHCVLRDEKGRWTAEVAMLAGALSRQIKAEETEGPRPKYPQADDALVGASPKFREAVEELGRIIRMPYGIVSGEPGVGKMYLIEAMWHDLTPDKPPVIVPCGSFFKDYYVDGRLRRYGGGRKAVDQLKPYMTEAEKGLLVLHHVERLPTALQEELVARLALSNHGSTKNAVRGIDSDGLASNSVQILATSQYAPEALRERGLIPELAVKLAKRHVHVPSLAERGPDDVQLICENILRRLVRRQYGTKSNWQALVPHFDISAMELLRQARCPNNISDLLRWVEFAWRHCNGGTIHRGILPLDISYTRTRAGTLDEILAQATRFAIRSALEQAGNDMKLAAEILGRNKNALHRLMDKLGMNLRNDA